MKVKKLSVISHPTSTGTLTTDPIRLDTYPYSDYVTLQVSCNAAYTGTVKLQGRTHPDQEWFDIGSTHTANSTATRDVILSRDHAPEFRVSSTRSSGAGAGTVTCWIAR